MNVMNERAKHYRPKLAVVVSHPIPYYVPLYRAIAAEGSVYVKAFFCSRIGLDEIMDPSGMGVVITWATDLLSGYDQEFLPEAPTINTTETWDVNNASITGRLEEFKPDVVLVHGYAHATLMRTILWCRRRGVPLLNISDRSFSGYSPPFRRIARRAVLPTILRQFTAFLCIGDRIETFYRSFGARDEQVFRIPIILDESFWKARAGRDEARARTRAELGIDRELAVLYVGKLIPRKRPQDLLEALVVLSRRPPTRRPVRVLFCGDGEMRAELEEKAAKLSLPATFLGFVNIDRLPLYYSAADVLAHPAEHESYGIIAVEAVIFGLPLVLSERVGAVGPTGVARPGENTIVHRAGDVVALADALQRLADEPETCESLSQASLKIADDHDGRLSVKNALAAIDYCLKTRGTRQRYSAQLRLAAGSCNGTVAP